MNASICLWHMKRAIKRKLKQLQSTGTLNYDPDRENAILSVIDRHYHMHPFFMPSLKFDTMQKIAIEELFGLLKLPAEKSILDYLYEHWYSGKTFFLWGRRTEGEIALSKTTMKVEAHWSMLKRLYLLPYNRPRVDLLLYVLENQIMPKFTMEYVLLKSGSKKPNWWKSFSAEWRQLQSRTSSGAYVARSGDWLCTCQYFIRSSNFVCKHVIAGKPLPAYRDIIRRRSPPFISIQRIEGQLIANYDCFLVLIH